MVLPPEVLTCSFYPDFGRDYFGKIGVAAAVVDLHYNDFRVWQDDQISGFI